MQKLLAGLLSVIVICIMPNLLSADATDNETPIEIATRLQNHYDTITSLSLNFHQDTRGEMAGRPRKGSGKALFYRDAGSNKMRWDYSAPDEQVLLSDGKNFFMYFAAQQQMIVTPAENLEVELTYGFFIGKGNLVEDFQILPADDNLKAMSGKSIKTIKLIPLKPQAQVQDIHLWVSSDSLLRRMHIQDHFGTVTVLNFSDIQINSLSNTSAEQVEELFNFTPPDDTEIIYQ